MIAIALCAGAVPARAHPGSGIVVDRTGQVYFLDTGGGVWKVDLSGKLVHLGGPLFHWMALDADDRFANVRLPSGAAGDISRVGGAPTVLVSSDFPIAMGGDGNLYYPTRQAGGAVRIMRLTPAGETSVLVTLPASDLSGRPLRDLNGLAAAPDGSLYFTENDAIRRITTQGEISTVVANVHLATCPAIPGMTPDDNPLLRGLQVDARGTVHVAASGCGSVLAVGPDGGITTVVQVVGPWSPTAVAVFGDAVYSLEYIHTATETSTSRREWIPRVRRTDAAGASTVIATVERN